MIHTVFSRVPKNVFCVLGIFGSGFHFQQCTFSLVADYKIHFQPGILIEIIELVALFTKDIGDQILAHDDGYGHNRSWHPDERR